MAENQNENIDDLLNDIALEPDNGNTEQSDTVPVNEDRIQDEYHDDELKIEPDNDSLEIEDTQQTPPTESVENDVAIDEDLLDDKEYAVQKKQTKLQKILIGVAAGLLTLIIVGIIAYFLGFFDPEEPSQKEEMKVEKEIKEEKPEINFNDKDINVDRLNQKLNMLTKYEIIEDAKKEEQKALEKERLHQEAQRKLEEERLAKIRRMQELEEKRLQEEQAALEQEQEIMESTEQVASEVKEVPVEIEESQEVIEVTKENKDITVTYEVEPEQVAQEDPMVPEVKVIEMKMPKVEETIAMPETDVMMEEETTEETLENNFIKFIVITTNKRDIYKKDLDKITSVDSNIKLCRDDSNNIEVFVGPFEENQRDIKMAVFKYAFKSENIEAVDFTQEEFDKRCNY